MPVQQQQQAVLTQQQQHRQGLDANRRQQQGAASGPSSSSALGTPGQQSKAATRSNNSSRASRSRGHRARAAAGDSQEPHGLGAVLPGRGRRRLQRSHSGPAVSVLRDVSSAGQVIRMAGELLRTHPSWSMHFMLRG
jgi:hypothetical protein